MTAEEIRERVIAAVRRHRLAHGGGADPMRDSAVVGVVVDLLDEERDDREAAAKAERKRVAAVSADALARWNAYLADLDRLDTSARAAVAARIAADADARSRSATADDDTWRSSLRTAAAAWWTAVRTRPAAAPPLIAEQVRAALGELLGRAP